MCLLSLQHANNITTLPVILLHIMGGDGGVIASNRKYLRGAGAAGCTADAKRESQKLTAAAEREAALEAMTTCAISKSPLNFASEIVACPYGRLYQREAALEALLRRKTTTTTTENDELGSHIRGLKDLYEMRMETKKTEDGLLIPVCPVTGVELNGKIPAFLILCQSRHQENNVISERAIKEMGMEALQAEYGPFDEQDDMIRLAPPSSMMESIQEKLKAEREREKLAKKKKKNGNKKRKKIVQNNAEREAKSQKTNGIGSFKANGTLADAARTRVASAVASNTVLSSIFTSDKASVSEKEKRDNLFAR